MKKYLKYILAIIAILIMGLVIFKYINKDDNNSENNINEDAINFSELYDIESDNIFRKISAKGAIDLIKNKTGIIYIGYNTCPWCKTIVPLLNEVAKEDNINTIYYLDDFYSMRPDKNENPTNELEYNELVSLLGSNIVDMSDDENSYDIIRVPLILFIKDGGIVDYHKGTYEGHTLKEKIDDNGNTIYYLDDLTDEQKKDIKEKLDEKIRKVYSNKCNDDGC